MKNAKSLAIVITFLVFFLGNTFSVNAQENESEIKIKTEFHCAGGKAKIEKEVSKTEGVSSVVADLETKVITIKYDNKKQNKKKLVQAIEKTGHKTEFSKKKAKIKSSCGSSHKEGDERNCDDSKE